MKGLSPEVRYRLCLMQRTFGSAAASSMNFSTEPSNDSYGWCTRMSPARMAAKMSASASSSPAGARTFMRGQCSSAMSVSAISLSAL